MTAREKFEAACSEMIQEIAKEQLGDGMNALVAENSLLRAELVRVMADIPAVMANGSLGPVLVERIKRLLAELAKDDQAE